MMRLSRLIHIDGQSMIEYAMIISVVVAALIGMNVYVQRAVQANTKIIQKQIIAEDVENSQARFIR